MSPASSRAAIQSRTSDLMLASRACDWSEGMEFVAMGRFSRSNLILIVTGLLCLAFFWATDPAIGIADHVMPPGLNRIDAANQARPGTYIGIVGSAGVILTGIWLLMKQPAA